MLDEESDSVGAMSDLVLQALTSAPTVKYNHCIVPHQVHKNSE